jgi:hypothetical protein
MIPRKRTVETDGRHYPAKHSLELNGNDERFGFATRKGLAIQSRQTRLRDPVTARDDVGTKKIRRRQCPRRIVAIA